MKTKSILLASALLMSASAFAQKNTFKGVVLDDQGEPVIGATIQVKGQKGALVPLLTWTVTSPSMLMVVRHSSSPTSAIRMPR